jgi:hypothetical protein
MMSIKSCCGKCGAFVCACGFAATLTVAVLAGGKPPPSRAVAPIVAQFTPAATTSATVGVSAPAVLIVANQIAGNVYSGVRSEKQQRGLAASPPKSLSIAIA